MLADSAWWFYVSLAVGLSQPPPPAVGLHQPPPPPPAAGLPRPPPPPPAVEPPPLRDSHDLLRLHQLRDSHDHLHQLRGSLDLLCLYQLWDSLDLLLLYFVEFCSHRLIGEVSNGIIGCDCCAERSFLHIKDWSQVRTFQGRPLIPHTLNWHHFLT